MAINESARRQGLVSGMSYSNALALCPELQTARAAPQEDRRRLKQLARWCERYGPSCNIHDESSLWVEITGTAHLFGGEKKLLEKISSDFLQRGHMVLPGLASTPGAAFALSRFAPTRDLQSRIAPSGKQQDFLASLPVEALRLCPDTVSLLHRLGLATIGQLLRLPRNSLKRRFSDKQQARAVLLRLDQMLGLRDEPLVPLSPPVAFESRLHFPDALASMQMLECALVRLVDDITGQMDKHRQGARQISLTLWRPDHSRARITIGTTSACRDSARIIRLFREKLQHREPGDNIEIAVLAVDRAELLSARQYSLDHTRKNRETEFPLSLIDRLQNRPRIRHIGCLQAVDSHIPEQAQKLSRPPLPQNTWPAAFPGDRNNNVYLSPRPFLLLNPPESVEIIPALPDGPPQHIVWRRARRKVIAATGPERLALEWWHNTARLPSAGSRDYYRVKTADGGDFWLCRQAVFEGKQKTKIPPRWFLHGFFG